MKVTHAVGVTDEDLEAYVRSLQDDVGPDFMFMADNATYKTNIVEDFTM